jgi:hypothetical protein
MIGQTILHYPDTKRRDAKQRHKILEKLRHNDGGQVGKGGMFSLNAKI